MGLMASTPPGVSAFPDEDNLLLWNGTVTGVDGTVSPFFEKFIYFVHLMEGIESLFVSNNLASPQCYEGLTYKLTLEFSANYPHTAPTVKFVTPIYHPNVDQYGNICLDILKEEWSACQNVSSILLSIQSLLGGKFFFSSTILTFLSSHSRLKSGDFHSSQLNFCCRVEPNPDSPLNEIAASVWNTNREGRRPTQEILQK